MSDIRNCSNCKYYQLTKCACDATYICGMNEKTHIHWKQLPDIMPCWTPRNQEKSKSTTIDVKRSANKINIQNWIPPEVERCLIT